MSGSEGGGSAAAHAWQVARISAIGFCVEAEAEVHFHGAPLGALQRTEPLLRVRIRRGVWVQHERRPPVDREDARADHVRGPVVGVAEQHDVAGLDGRVVWEVEVEEVEVEVVVAEVVEVAVAARHLDGRVMLLDP